MCTVKTFQFSVLEQTFQKFYCSSLRNHCPSNTPESIYPHPFYLIFTESTQQWQDRHWHYNTVEFVENYWLRINNKVGNTHPLALLQYKHWSKICSSHKQSSGNENRNTEFCQVLFSWLKTHLEIHTKKMFRARITLE